MPAGGRGSVRLIHVYELIDSVGAMQPPGSSSTMSVDVRLLLFACLLWVASPTGVHNDGSATAGEGFCQRPETCKMEDSGTYLQMLQLDLAVKSANSDIASFLWLTDVHVDPFYHSPDRQCHKKELSLLERHPFGTIGCDPPPSLLYSVLEGAAAWLEATSNASFVLFTGDFVRHDLPRMQNPANNASDIVENVSTLARDYFPHAPMVFGTLGNNDNPCDYCEQITTGSAVNEWFWKIGSRIKKATCMTEATLEQYKYGSFFEVAVGGLTILSISTVIYSTLHVPGDMLEADPFGQFAWLRTKLAEAVESGRSVWIVGHIPPGMETFGFTELWWPEYVTKYLALVQDPALGPTVAAQLFGHVHKDEVRVLPNPPPGAGPIFLSSSISPVYYNNPSFKMVQYNRTSGRLLDFKTIYADITADGKPLQWKFGYDLLQTYPDLKMSGITAGALANLTDSLLTGKDSWKRYARWYAAGYPSDLQHYGVATTDSEANATYKLQRRKQYVCAAVIRTAAEYQDCVGLTQHGPPASASFEETERLIVGKLLSWAYLSAQPLAQVVLELARREDWGALLALFGDVVESSLHSGIPLDSVLG